MEEIAWKNLLILPSLSSPLQLLPSASSLEQRQAILAPLVNDGQKSQSNSIRKSQNI